ncbi:MAG TPA: response regulator transcription factor [Dissulfurispiraceae bacterium]|nr:response regulator transcription factor [Dissulfurispiraceae bacterium]
MIRVVIADDHMIFRQGLCSLLSSSSGILIEGQASTGSAAMALIRSRKPDVAIVDISMPGTGGLEVAEAVVRDGLTTKVILLTMHNDPSTAELAVKSGAAAFIPKDNAFDELLNAINVVADGGTFVSASQQEEMRGDSDLCALTLKETEIVRLIAMGLTNKEIANELQVSIKTVETHKGRVMYKLKKNKTADLVRFAVRQGIVDE